MKHRKNNEPSQRQRRVAEQIKHILSETLLRGGHVDDPTLLDTSAITVTEVSPSPDLKQATAYVIMMGGGEIQDVLPALNNAASHFQKEINRKANLKFTPRIRFVEDKTFNHASRIEDILRNLPPEGNQEN